MENSSQEKNLSGKKASCHILRSVPYELGFHFYISHGNYSGITANSLGEFVKKLRIIPVESIFFHFTRDDFQTWLREVIDDEEMATLLDQYKEWPSWTSGENLRADLIKIVQKHIDKLMLSS